MPRHYRREILTLAALALGVPQRGVSQTTASPLPTPPITGPLQAAPAHAIDAGPLGQIDLNGVVSGVGLWQGHPLPSAQPTQATLSNGQVFVQKTTGWWQFYVQAGAYDIPILGAPFLSAEKTMSDLFGPVPVAFLKLAPGKHTSILVGVLPTLMGAESTFTFQNMSVERGLLWNQENDVNRGIQVNQTLGKFSASLSWNDGYYSNRYSWLSGSFSYTHGPHTLTVSAMGNLDETRFQTLATPVQNNGRMYALNYAWSKGSWIVQPYLQYGDVPTNPNAGIMRGAATRGGALLVSHNFGRGFSVAGRGEYLSSTGTPGGPAVNLLYGPGSSAWSLTLTPTFQVQRMFVRGELSFVSADDITRGDAFGPGGVHRNQPRAALEAGFIL